MEILGSEVRPLSAMTNDSVYNTRFMLPYYYQDEINFLEGEGMLNHSQQLNSSVNVKRYSKLPFGGSETEDADA